MRTSRTSLDRVAGERQLCRRRPAHHHCTLHPPAFYEVTGNDSRIGDYPAGETVNLGSFRSNQTFAITGKNTLVAELYIRNP